MCDDPGEFSSFSVALGGLIELKLADCIQHPELPAINATSTQSGFRFIAHHHKRQQYNLYCAQNTPM
jgi:hypothetical protein